MYENLNYFDQYGGSVILFVIISIVFFLAVSYCFVMINAKPIADDWPNQRCKPNIIPFAGLITHPDDITASEYTAENFSYCIQNILSDITGEAISPLTFVTNSLLAVSNGISESLQAIRGMIDKVRTFAQSIFEEIMGRIMNIMIPLQQIIMSFKDFVGKIQGTLTGGLFTLLGSYYTLKSLMGAIAQFIIIILIAIAVVVAILWILPFTWGLAATNTAIFIAIAIPMAIILAFMIDVLKVKTSLSIPSIKCFDKNTLFTMNDGSTKIISEIKVGDILLNNNEVTAVVKVDTKGSSMYFLDGICVSDTHKIFYHRKWICVHQHPNAIKVSQYNEPYLYCLNTTKKTIQINNLIFSDWDEIDENDFIEITNNPFIQINEVSDIHTFLDSGFEGSTPIVVNSGEFRNIKDICVGDILQNGEKVYGIVEINGKNINEQYKFILGENLVLEGGPNLAICDKKIKEITTLEFPIHSTTSKTKFSYKIELNKKHDKLYHLLTDKKSFQIGDIQFYDYNAAIDIFLKKNNEKLLSMKYV
jgi:hypothetical protein